MVGPTQRITFLGVVIDSVKRTIECTQERVQQLRTRLSTVKQQQSITRHEFDSLLGRLSFAAQVLPGARPFTRQMRDAGLNCSTLPNANITITSKFREDVDFWQQRLDRWNGRATWRSNHSVPYIIATDASKAGFGFYMERNTRESEVGFDVEESTALDGPVNGMGYSGKFSSEFQEADIGTREMLAVLAAITTFASMMANSSVRIMCDNESDVAIINRQATRSQSISILLRQMFTLSFDFNIRIEAVHRAGVLNELADFLSRPHRHQDQHLAEWRRIHNDTNQANRLCAVHCFDSSEFLRQHLSTNSSPS